MWYSDYTKRTLAINQIIQHSHSIKLIRWISVNKLTAMHNILLVLIYCGICCYYCYMITSKNHHLFSLTGKNPSLVSSIGFALMFLFWNTFSCLFGVFLYFQKKHLYVFQKVGPREALTAVFTYVMESYRDGRSRLLLMFTVKDLEELTCHLQKNSDCALFHYKYSSPYCQMSPTTTLLPEGFVFVCCNYTEFVV